jgi:adenylate cyclase
MNEKRVERRLAAILAADVAGYSRLMGEDEAGTLARLRSHRRELIDPKIAEHKGRIVKTTGDGLLVEFPSVVEAVACAVAIQRGMPERNAPIPNSERIDFRVGINLGDVIAEDNDIHGNGVNIASRLDLLHGSRDLRIAEDAWNTLPVRDRVPLNNFLVRASLICTRIAAPVRLAFAIVYWLRPTAGQPYN